MVLAPGTLAVAAVRRKLRWDLSHRQAGSGCRGCLVLRQRAMDTVALLLHRRCPPPFRSYPANGTILPAASARNGEIARCRRGQAFSTKENKTKSGGAARCAGRRKRGAECDGINGPKTRRQIVGQEQGGEVQRTVAMSCCTNSSLSQTEKSDAKNRS